MKDLKEDFAQVVFKLSEHVNLSDHHLDLTLQNVAWAMDGKRSLDVIAREDRYNLEDLIEKANHLMELGIIEAHQTSQAIIDQEFILMLSKQLSKSLGPVTDILIADTAKSLGHPLTNFPSHKLAHFVDLLSQEIQGHEELTDFKQTISEMAKAKNYY